MQGSLPKITDYLAKRVGGWPSGVEAEIRFENRYGGNWTPVNIDKVWRDRETYQAIRNERRRAIWENWREDNEQHRLMIARGRHGPEKTLWTRKQAAEQVAKKL